jgi:hypothetical protein
VKIKFPHLGCEPVSQYLHCRKLIEILAKRYPEDYNNIRININLAIEAFMPQVLVKAHLRDKYK